MALSKKNKFYLAIVTLIILLSLIAFYIYLLEANFKAEKPATLTINQQVIKIEIASDLQHQYKGLSKRESLCDDCGMLFVWPQKDIREFVMRDMNFPLDILFISDGKILNIEKNLKPQDSNQLTIYRSLHPADMVLEINGGYSEKNNIQVGDRVIINKNI